MPWNVIDSYSQLRLEIVWDKYWDLFNNISLIYRSLNMRLVFNIFLRLSKYLHGIKRMFSINKKKWKYIFNYIARVISNLSNRYIYIYWTGPPTFTSYDKCMDKCSIESKNDGENIISSLHIVWTIFISSLSKCCVCNLLEHISLKK